MASFGELLGAEILEAREAQRLTQLALAEEVFDDENYVRRIGDYETGKVKRPQAKVYRPICDFLGITSQTIGALKAQAADTKTVTEDEMAALREEKGSLEQALSDLQTLSRAQLETLASRFELDKPYQATDGALVEFLANKAQDYRALRAEVDAIEDGLKRLSNLKSAAQAAIGAGDLDEVEVLLSRVQEVELEEAAKTAQLRATNALLRGKVEQAFRILSAAADSFAAVDPLLPVLRRLDWAESLYAHGLRYGGDGMIHAIAMNRAALDLMDKDDMPLLWAEAQNNLAVALGIQGTRTPGEDGAHLLAQAVSAYRAALEVFTRDAHPVQWATIQNNLAIALQGQGTRTPGEDGARLLAQAVSAYRAALEVTTRDAHPVDWAMTQNNLAVALQEQGTRTPGEDGAHLLAEAVSACRAALEVRTRDAHPVQWAMTQNNLANALQEQGTRTPGEDGARLLAQAVSAYRAALEVRTRDAHPVQWAMTQNNLASALQEQGTRTPGEDGAHLLAQAVSAYRAALEVRTRDAHPVQWAMTQNNLANALGLQGTRTPGEDGARLLAQAVSAYRAALEVTTRDAHPVDWAMTQENLAIAEEARADHDSCADPEPHLRAALDHVTGALEIYDPEHMAYHFDKATDLKTELENRLAALDAP